MKISNGLHGSPGARRTANPTRCGSSRCSRRRLRRCRRHTSRRRRAQPLPQEDADARRRRRRPAGLAAAGACCSRRRRSWSPSSHSSCGSRLPSPQLSMQTLGCPAHVQPTSCRQNGPEQPSPLEDVAVVAGLRAADEAVAADRRGSCSASPMQQLKPASAWHVNEQPSPLVDVAVVAGLAAAHAGRRRRSARRGSARPSRASRARSGRRRCSRRRRWRRRRRRSRRPGSVPLPHTNVQTLGWPVQMQPASTWQVLEQPSPLVPSPSSQASPCGACTSAVAAVPGADARRAVQV